MIPFSPSANEPPSLLFCIRPEKKKKKKDVCLPFSDRPKILGKKGRLFFFFLILNFAFLTKIFKLNIIIFV